ncbi:unnamed protein product [Clonostachys byssicola]|uniref:Uncharacterized protein n=1 Tax=Clonostachys byssicola TaxID=160290 RepID=A0A9N9U4D5_9HYPO|nr:unnamed protein product [Clonostachys byssicola]
MASDLGYVFPEYRWFAEEWHVQELDERPKIVKRVLNRCAGKAPAPLRRNTVHGSELLAGPVSNVISQERAENTPSLYTFVQDKSIPVDLVQGTVAATAFSHHCAVRSKYDVLLIQPIIEISSPLAVVFEISEDPG